MKRHTFRSMSAWWNARIGREPTFEDELDAELALAFLEGLMLHPNVRLVTKRRVISSACFIPYCPCNRRKTHA